MQNKFLIAAILLFSCLLLDATSHAREDDLTINKKRSTVVKKIESLQICINGSKDCINERRVISDFFNKEYITMINNYGVIGNDTLIGLNNSVKYYDGKDYYAIFILQTNKLDANGIQDCHACAPNIGIAIYQFHNNWKLFAVKNNITDLGSFGTLMIDSGNFKIIPVAEEKFLISIGYGFMNQGYSEQSEVIFAVNYQYRFGESPIDNTVPIKYLGYIPTGGSQCGAREDGEEWSAELSFNTTQKNGQLTATVQKNFQRCGKGGGNRMEKDLFKYDAHKNEFIKVPK